MLGIIVGLAQEARLAERYFPHAKIALSHAHEAGAKRAVASLKEAGVTELLSFGCAGGLDRTLQPGTIQLADYVFVEGKKYPTSPALNTRFGAGQAVIGGGVYHSPIMLDRAAEKAACFTRSQCSTVDMESGLVAQAGLPFAVLRVVCDDAGRDLPPAARDGLREGRIDIAALMGSLIRHPLQIGALISLGRDAAYARRVMERFLQKITS